VEPENRDATHFVSNLLAVAALFYMLSTTLPLHMVALGR